jgi:hypothetical protein
VYRNQKGTSANEFTARYCCRRHIQNMHGRLYPELFPCSCSMRHTDIYVSALYNARNYTVDPRGTEWTIRSDFFCCAVLLLLDYKRYPLFHTQLSHINAEIMYSQGILRYSPGCIDLSEVSEDVVRNPLINPMKSVTWGPTRVYFPVPFPESEEEGSLDLDELDDDVRL